MKGKKKIWLLEWPNQSTNPSLITIYGRSLNLEFIGGILKIFHWNEKKKKLDQIPEWNLIQIILNVWE